MNRKKKKIDLNKLKTEPVKPAHTSFKRRWYHKLTKSKLFLKIKSKQRLLHEQQWYVRLRYVWVPTINSYLKKIGLLLNDLNLLGLERCDYIH